MQPTLISRFVALMVVKQELAMAKESFNTVEMAFVYGVVTMALASSASSNRGNLSDVMFSSWYQGFK